MKPLLDNQDHLANAVLLASLALVLLLEMWWPRRSSIAPHAPRWRLHFLLLGVNTLFLYVVVPVTTAALAGIVQVAGWGLMNRLAIPGAVAWVTGVLALDAARYVQHLLMHRVPFLWRIHRLHHSDRELDVTTSFRFHPLETLAGIVTDSLVIVTLGVPATAVIAHRLFRVALSAFDHGNLYVPRPLESCLRFLVVTPDMHRIHHSTVPAEQLGNFSGGLIWWDRLFGTYIPAPSDAYPTMALGLTPADELRTRSLRSALLEPFVQSAASRRSP